MQGQSVCRSVSPRRLERLRRAPRRPLGLARASAEAAAGVNTLARSSGTCGSASAALLSMPVPRLARGGAFAMVPLVFSALWPSGVAGGGCRPAMPPLPARRIGSIRRCSIQCTDVGFRRGDAEANAVGRMCAPECKRQPVRAGGRGPRASGPREQSLGSVLCARRVPAERTQPWRDSAPCWRARAFRGVRRVVGAFYEARWLS